MGQIGYFFNIIFTYPIFNILMLLNYLVGDFALSIILLTVIIRLLLFPLTLKQLRSTKAMQSIQPLIADVKKQYPKDQRAQLEATQAIYKEYGINPAAGCLPLVVQLPVLYGLFYALNNVLRNASVQSINNIIYPFLPKLSSHTNLAALTDFRWFTFINRACALAPVAPAAPLGFAPPIFVDQNLAGGEPLVTADPVHGTLVYTSHEGTTHLYQPGLALLARRG